MIEAEVGVMQPQVQGRQGFLETREARRGQGKFPEVPAGTNHTFILYFQRPELRERNLCCCDPPGLWHVVTVAPGSPHLPDDETRGIGGKSPSVSG